MLIQLLFALAISSCVADNTIKTCTLKVNGKTYDLNPLISPNGLYRWTQTVYPQDDTNFLNGISENQAPPQTFTFELQICKNVVSQTSSCTQPSPANWITESGNCTSVGNIEIATIDQTPGKDGAVLSYYHGTPATHIQNYQSRVYVICDPNKNGTIQPYAEHLKNFYQWHFRIDTHLVC